MSSELRPLASARFDSQALLCVVLAGNASLMTKELRHTLRDHTAGNYRIFVSMAAESLMTAAQRVSGDRVVVLFGRCDCRRFVGPYSSADIF